MRRTVPSTVLITLLCTSAAAAQAQTAPPPPPTTVDASRGGITITSGVNSLTIGARAQFRWTVDDREGFDSDTAGAGVGSEDGALSQFDVPRLRLTLSGGMFRPWMRYLFQFDFSRTGGEGASKIKDAILEIRPTGRSFRSRSGSSRRRSACSSSTHRAGCNSWIGPLRMQSTTRDARWV